MKNKEIEFDMIVTKVLVPNEIVNITSIATNKGIKLRPYNNYFFTNIQDDELILKFDYDDSVTMKKFHQLILQVYDKLKEENKLIKLKTPWYYEDEDEDKTKNEFKMVYNVMILKENGTREDIQKWTGKNIESILYIAINN